MFTTCGLTLPVLNALHSARLVLALLTCCCFAKAKLAPNMPTMSEASARKENMYNLYFFCILCESPNKLEQIFTLYSSTLQHFINQWDRDYVLPSNGTPPFRLKTRAST